MGERARDLFDILRSKCLSRGCGGIKDLAVVFRKMDIDYSKRLTKEELRDGTHMYGLQLNDSDLNILFLSFDMDENKTIDFSEFLHRLRPSMSQNRQDVIMESFDKWDVNTDGHLNVDDLKGTCYRDIDSIVFVSGRGGKEGERVRSPKRGAQLDQKKMLHVKRRNKETYSHNCIQRLNDYFV